MNIKGTNKAKLNINDIARMAGVSKATVSRVLNNIKVRPEYKAKVDKVIKDTGYKPNRLARELVSRKTKLIGMVIPSIKPSVFSYVVEGANQVLSKKGYSLILSTTLKSEKNELISAIEVFDFMKERHVEGVIYVPQVITEGHLDYLKNYNVPVVTMGEKIKTLDIPAVTFDDYYAAKKIVKLLIDFGHREIGYIGVSDKYFSMGKMRKKGYLDALEEEGIAIEEGRIIKSGFSAKEGYDSAEILFSKKDLKTTAVFAGLDRIAYGTMSYLNKAGYEIPRDVSVVAIDDDEFSSFYNPPLTTVYYDFVKAGEVVGQMIMDLIEKNDETLADQIIEFAIKERESVFLKGR